MGYVEYSPSQGNAISTVRVYYNIYSFISYTNLREPLATLSCHRGPGGPCQQGNPNYPPPNMTVTTSDPSVSRVEDIGATHPLPLGPTLQAIALPPCENVTPQFLGSSSVTDTNGNQITGSYSPGSATFTDTLGGTVLTITDAGSPIATRTFTYYTGPNTSASVTERYTSFNIKSNFGCSGIIEYSASSVPMVTEIDMPDNTKYKLTYEGTPNNSGYYTGRLGSVTLPTGREFQYAYTGGHNGINCTDGTIPTLVRTTPDGIWYYSHTESGSTWTTEVTDPASNATYYDFQGTYPTEVTNALETVNTCYNGASVPCNSTAITLPIANRTVQLNLPSLSPSKTYTTYNTYGLPTEVDEYDWGPTITRKTVTAYDYNTSCGVTNANVVSRPCSVTIENGSGTPQASTSYAYSANGNLQSQTSDGLTKSYTYNGNGTLATVTDVNNAQTGYTYGSAGCGAFPTTITPPAGPALNLTWNCYGAVLATSNDGNGTTTYGYTDPFWRVTSITDPTNAETSITYTPYTTSTPASVESVMNFGSSSTVDTLTTLDGLGRVSLTQRRQAHGSTTFDSVETKYDSLGRTYEVSPPYSAMQGGTYSGIHLEHLALRCAKPSPVVYRCGGRNHHLHLPGE